METLNTTYNVNTTVQYSNHFYDSILETLKVWRKRARARREMRRIPAGDFIDIGINPNMASFEAHQPFWRPLRDLRK